MISFAGLRDRDGIKEREEGERGGGGGRRLRLITPDNPLITSTLIIVDIAKTSSNNCLIFPSKGGDYSREATNSGMAIIRGSTVCCVYIRREKCQSKKTQDHL